MIGAVFSKLSHFKKIWINKLFFIQQWNHKTKVNHVIDSEFSSFEQSKWIELTNQNPNRKKNLLWESKNFITSSRKKTLKH